MALKKVEDIIKEQKRIIKTKTNSILQLELKLLAVELIKAIKEDLTIKYNENQLSINSNELSDNPFYIVVKIENNKIKVLTEGHHEKSETFLEKIYNNFNLDLQGEK